jgi:predicted transcriptional regulator
MSSSEGVYDLLFELSNEHRHWILLLLQKKAMRITDIGKEMELNNPEIRRHISRLRDVGLIQRDVEGYYHLTPYGVTSLVLFQEFEFLSLKSEYFKTHSLSRIPTHFVKRIGELSESKDIMSVIDFFRHTESLLRESNEYVWLLVDQFPLNSLSTIVEAIEHGVQFKIVEPVDMALSPDIDSMTSEEAQDLIRARHTPLSVQKTLEKVNVILYISEKRCILAFPTSDGQYDYTGFTATDDSSLNWCRDLFHNYWDEGIQRTSALPSERMDKDKRS